MSTLMSKDIVVNRSSTRLHAPPGGVSTISFGDASTTTPPPMASVSSPIKTREDTNEIAARPIRHFVPSSGAATISLGDDTIPSPMASASTRVPSDSIDASGTTSTEDINENKKAKNDLLKSQIVILIANPLTDVQNAASTAIVRSLVAEGVSTNDITVTYINEPLSLPYAVQRIANSCSVIIASAVLSGVDANTTSNMISGSLYQQGLQGNIRIVPAIIVRDSLLETKAMLPQASTGWAKAAVAMLDFDVDIQVEPAQEPEKRDADITQELAKKFSTETSDSEILMANLRVTVAQHGARGIHGLARKFKIIDDDNSGTINFSEFTKFINEHAMHWTLAQVKAIFDHFDVDKSGGISFDEFLVALRGEINDRRKQMILLAFDVLDTDRSGSVEINDIVAKYDASKHPDVKSGKRTAESVLKEFLDTFDGNKDGSVTPLEFIKYYENVSSSIDDDDYFELMIRNAWHISGGEGWCANTTCRRILVTHNDGRQTVEEIKNDIGVNETDVAAMIANLAAQGINDVASIEVKGASSSSTEATSASAAAVPTLTPQSPVKEKANANTPPPQAPQPYGRRGAKGGASSIIFG